MAKEIKEPVKYTCTSCGGDAYIAFVPETIKRVKLK